MNDDKQERGSGDRATVAAGETYEVAYFAKKHKITQKEAKALIDRVGNNREALEAAIAERGTTSGRSKKPSARATSQARPAQKPAAVGNRRAPESKVSIQRVASTSRSLKNAGGVATLVGAAAGLATGLAINLGRKALVQAPSALAGDWFEALKTEHRLAITIFDKLEATTDKELRKRSALLTQLQHALGKHAFTEENVIYPALRDRCDKADADKLNHEHGYVKQYLYDLEDMDNANPAFLPKVRAFRDDLEDHIRQEESEIFPVLHAALGTAGNAKVTALANKEGFKLA